MTEKRRRERRAPRARTSCSSATGSARCPGRGRQRLERRLERRRRASRAAARRSRAPMRRSTAATRPRGWRSACAIVWRRRPRRRPHPRAGLRPGAGRSRRAGRRGRMVLVVLAPRLVGPPSGRPAVRHAEVVGLQRPHQGARAVAPALPQDGRRQRGAGGRRSLVRAGDVIRVGYRAAGRGLRCHRLGGRSRQRHAPPAACRETPAAAWRAATPSSWTTPTSSTTRRAGSASTWSRRRAPFDSGAGPRRGAPCRRDGCARGRRSASALPSALEQSTFSAPERRQGHDSHDRLALPSPGRPAPRPRSRGRRRPAFRAGRRSQLRRPGPARRSSTRSRTPSASRA